MQLQDTIKGLGRRLQAASKTIAGDAAERLLFEGDATTRKAVIIHNHSATYKVYLKLSELTAGETLTATDKDMVISPEDTVVVYCTHDIQLWVMNSAGDATTSSIEALEVEL